MNPNQHFSGFSSLEQAIVGFGQQARELGFNVGVQETIDSLLAATSGITANKDHFRYALKAIYCCAEEDSEAFDALFNAFWNKRRHLIESKVNFKNRSNLQKKGVPSLVMVGQGKQEEGGTDTKNVSGANDMARLRKTDFSRLSEMDSKWMEEIAQKLWEQMSMRLKRKLKATPRGGQLDLKRTIRASLSYGGDPIKLQYKNRKPRKPRLITILDVSGSMDKYSFFLLRFLFALRSCFEKLETFIFSTQLMRITEELQAKNLDYTLAMLSSQANHWSGGTRIGECFKTFNDQHAKRILNGDSTVIILSDGLDTGDPEDLARELKKIKLRTRQLVWLNPLKGMQGYEPVQKGMRAALPEVDVFKSAHNLDSILELEKLLMHV